MEATKAIFGRRLLEGLASREQMLGFGLALGHLNCQFLQCCFRADAIRSEMVALVSLALSKPIKVDLQDFKWGVGHWLLDLLRPRSEMVHLSFYGLYHFFQTKGWSRQTLSDPTFTRRHMVYDGSAVNTANPCSL